MGLSVADIIFVEEVEGTQTRLVAVYHSKFPDRLGPVRSAGNIHAASIVPLSRSTRDTAGSRRTTWW